MRKLSLLRSACIVAVTMMVKSLDGSIRRDVVKYAVCKIENE